MYILYNVYIGTSYIYAYEDNHVINIIMLY